MTHGIAVDAKDSVVSSHIFHIGIHGLVLRRRMSRPAIPALVHKGIFGGVALHRYDIDGPGVAEIALQSALYFKEVAFNQVCHMGVPHIPFQHIVSGIGVQRVFLLLHYEIVDTVVGGDGDGIGGLVGHHHRRRLPAIDIELGLEAGLQRVGGRHIDIARALVGRIRGAARQRRGIGFRVVIHHIGHGGSTIARYVGLFCGVEEGIVQLRRHHRVSTTEPREIPIEVIVHVTRQPQRNLDIGPDIEFQRIEFLGHVPVYLQPGHVVVAVIRFPRFGDIVGVGMPVVGHHLTRTGVNVGYLNDTFVGTRLHIHLTIRHIIVVIDISLVRVNIEECMLRVGVALLVVELRGTIAIGTEVIVTRAA